MSKRSKLPPLTERGIRSTRGTQRIERLFVVLSQDEDGKEGVVRRTTPFGTMPLITDDPKLAEAMLAIVREENLLPAGTPMRVAEFHRR
jgi:hypothetical protein